MQANRLAVLAGLFAGLCWGIFWLPLRMVEEGGFDAPWAMAFFTAIPALMCLPLIWMFRDDYRRLAPLLGGPLGGWPLRFMPRRCFIRMSCGRCCCSI